MVIFSSSQWLKLQGVENEAPMAPRRDAGVIEGVVMGEGCSSSKQSSWDPGERRGLSWIETWLKMSLAHFNCH